MKKIEGPNGIMKNLMILGRIKGLANQVVL